MTKPLTKEQKAARQRVKECERVSECDISAPKGKQPALGLPATNMKLSGFNGEALKQTTPKQVQDAANEYFDKKFAWEKCKDAVELALEHIGAEMAALNVQSVVVRNLDGEPTIVRIKKSSKLEIKKIK